MLVECEECGVWFKTDSPNRKTCYGCTTALKITVEFPEAIELPEAKAAKKR